MNRYLSIALLLLCLPTGCGPDSGDGGGGLPVIDVAGNLGSYRQIPMSELIEEVEYIPLETRSECLLGQSGYDVVVTEGRIFIAADYDHCYSFSREGEFVTNIGREGRGPGEYFSVWGISVDEAREIVYVDNTPDILEYQWDGTFVRRFETPRLNDVSVSSVSFLCDSLFIGHIRSDLGLEPSPHSWVVFDDTGAIVKAFDNHTHIEKDKFSSSGFMSSMPVKMSGDMYVKVGIEDTLYRIDRQLELSPAFVFDFGQYTFPLDIYLTNNNIVEIFMNSVQTTMTTPFIVSQGNIFFRINVWDGTSIHKPQGVKSQLNVMGSDIEGSDSHKIVGLYDIRRGKTELLDRDPISKRFGFVNDIDGGLSFWPQYYIESENALVQVLEAYEMKGLLTEEYFAAHPAKDPAAHARLRELLKNLKEDDNPVIVVAKLKK